MRNKVAQVGDLRQGFEIINHLFVIATANLEENLDEHRCLWECHVSFIRLQEITCVETLTSSFVKCIG